MNHRKIDELARELLKAQAEIDAIKARINYWQEYRPNDLETVEVVLSNIAYLESKKATMERMALNRAFALAHSVAYALGELDKGVTA